MAFQRVTLTDLSGRTPLRLGGRSVHDDHARATALLASLVGQEAAALFSLPAVTLGNGTAKGNAVWSTMLAGEIVPFESLAEPMRSAVAGQVRGIVEQLLPLFSHPELGAWLRRALVVSSPAAVFAVGGAPVLVDWGMASPGVTESPAVLERAMRAGLAAFLEGERMPPLAPPPPPPVGTAPITVGGAAVGTAMAAAAIPGARAPTRAPVEGVRWLLPAGIVVAPLFLALGLWIGAEIVRAQMTARPSVAGIVEDEAGLRRTVELQRQENEGLEQRIAEARAGLSGNMCTIDPAMLPRLGPDRSAPVAPGALPPPQQGARQPPFTGKLADLLDQAVVLVVVKAQSGIGTGTGFFITSELIVTNHHVVETGGDVMVVNKALGHGVPAQVIARTPNSEAGKPDFAILKVPAQNVQPIGLTPTIARLDEVIAAGFPALVSQIDPIFQAIIRGDTSAVAQLQSILSDGKIQAIQPMPSGLQVMPHSAQISPGSSGGPLVDACGRVVGVNTFGRSSDKMPITVNYAQKADSLVTFLKANNIAPTELSGPCTPAPALATPAPVTPTAATAAGAAPAPVPPR